MSNTLINILQTGCFALLFCCVWFVLLLTAFIIKNILFSTFLKMHLALGMITRNFLIKVLTTFNMFGNTFYLKGFED